MDYQIIQLSGRQYIIKNGLWHNIDHVRKSNNHDLLYATKSLFIRDNHQIKLGLPFLMPTFLNKASIIGYNQGKKLTILKTKPKKKYTRTWGHRKLYTKIMFNSI